MRWLALLSITITVSACGFDSSGKGDVGDSASGSASGTAADEDSTSGTASDDGTGSGGSGSGGDGPDGSGSGGDATGSTGGGDATGAEGGDDGAGTCGADDGGTGPCPDVCNGGCSGGTCHIECGETASRCVNTSIHCPEGWPCVLHCRGPEACMQMNYVCVGRRCELECIGSGACGSMTMNCGPAQVCRATCDEPVLTITQSCAPDACVCERC